MNMSTQHQNDSLQGLYAVKFCVRYKTVGHYTNIVLNVAKCIRILNYNSYLINCCRSYSFLFIILKVIPLEFLL